MRAAPGNIFNPLSQVTINYRLRRERNLAVFIRRFQQIANIKASPLADFARNYNLKFSLYRYKFHDFPLLESQQINRTT